MRKKNRKLFGIGVNDADYPVSRHEIIDGKSKIVWTCPYYIVWSSMLCRSYSVKFKKDWPNYLDCTSVKEWHYFMTFRAWMEKQDWKDKQLDKDLLVPGNKIYGPDTCVFVSQEVNKFITDSKSARGDLPVGVTEHKRSGKYMARCGDLKKTSRKYLGLFETPLLAYQAWLDHKRKLAKILASQQTDPRVARALISWYEDYINYE